MTNEKAREVLKEQIDRYGQEYDEEGIEALEMAIKALEQQSCEDWYDVPSDEMTLEQARQAVKDLRKKLAEYLEQQPCEDWLQTFNTDSATECFTAVQRLKESLNDRLDEGYKG